MQPGQTYLYKVYSSTGTFIGLLDPNKVISDFTYNQTIGTAAVQTQITLLETTPDQTIYTRENIIRVYEFSQYYPNGTKVFDGYISKAKPINSNDTLLLTCISQGQDMSQYLARSANILDQSQATDSSNVTVNAASFVSNNVWLGQEVNPGAGVVNITKFTLEMAAVTTNNPQVTVTLYNGISGLAQYAASTAGILQRTITVSSTSKSVYTFFLYCPLVASYTILSVKCTDASGVKVYGNSSLTSGFNSAYNAWFNTYTMSDVTNISYPTGTDPSFMLTDITYAYEFLGGLVQQPAAGYPLTGTTTTYGFNAQTYLSQIQALMQLMPATWYWYVHPGLNQLIAGPANTVADIVLTNGKEINDFEPEASKESIINNVYFTGGDDGTGTNTNVFVNVTGTLGTNRVGLAQITDNRVNYTNLGSLANAQAVGTLIAQNYIDRNSSETTLGTITLLDGVIDNNLVNIGLMIGFQGFGDYRDNLLLQVVSKSKMSDKCTYQLGTLPVSQSSAVAAIEANLAYVQTVNNPDIAS